MIINQNSNLTGEGGRRDVTLIGCIQALHNAIRRFNFIVACKIHSQMERRDRCR